MVDFKQLKYFVQIAEAGSLSRAAEQLNVVQPSLSQQLRKLEDQLGVELVTRHSRGVTPNEVGRLLLDHARSLLLQLQRTEELVQYHASNPSGEVRLGLPTSAARGLTIPLVNAVEDRYPGISLHVVEGMSGHLTEWLHVGRLDMALLYDAKSHEGIHVQPLMVEDLYLICPPNREFRRMKAIRFADAAKQILVLPALPHTIRLVLEETAARTGGALSVRIDLDSLPSMIELVFEGYCTVLPLFAVSKEVAAGQMTAVPLIAPQISWQLSIASVVRGVQSRATRAVSALMLEVMERMVRNGEWPGRLL